MSISKPDSMVKRLQVWLDITIPMTKSQRATVEEFTAQLEDAIDMSRPFTKLSAKLHQDLRWFGGFLFNGERYDGYAKVDWHKGKQQTMCCIICNPLLSNWGVCWTELPDDESIKRENKLWQQFYALIKSGYEGEIVVE